MAFTATLDWEVRTTGNDGNGGAFDPTTAGTDYSQQDTAQVTYSDLVIDATINNACTSAGNPFTSLHVGNVINITGGTGFTVQRVQVTSVTSGQATVDKSLGTLSSTGGVGKLGGAMLTVLAANTARASGNVIHLKAGNYASGAITLGTANATTRTSAIIGFATTHRDGGTKPVLQANANSITLLTLGAQSNMFENITLDANAHTSCTGIATTNNPGNKFFRCLVKGFATGFAINNSAQFMDYCEFTGGAIGVTLANAGTITANDCEMHDNTGVAFVLAGTSPTGSSLLRCQVHNNSGATTDGVTINGAPATMRDCNFYHNGRDGIRNATGSTINVLAENCLFVNNGGWGFNGGAFGSLQMLRNCAGFNNVSGMSQNVEASYNIGFITLTADPYVSASTTSLTNQNFGLNTTAGGGALLRAQGWPNTWPFSTNTVNYADVGPVQHQDSGSAGIVAAQRIIASIGTY